MKKQNAIALSDEIKNDVEKIINYEQVIKYLFQDLEDWGSDKASFMQETALNIAQEVLTLNIEKIHLFELFENLPAILAKYPGHEAIIQTGLLCQVNDWQNKAIMLSLYTCTEDHPEFVKALSPLKGVEIDPGFFDGRVVSLEQSMEGLNVEELTTLEINRAFMTAISALEKTRSDWEKRTPKALDILDAMLNEGLEEQEQEEEQARHNNQRK